MSKEAKRKTVLGGVVLSAVFSIGTAGVFMMSSAQHGASQPQAAPQVSGDAAKGKAIFNDNCAFCHSAESTDAGVGPGLKDLFKWPAHKLSDGTEHKEHTVEIIKKQVSEGGGGMAPMGENVKGQDLDDLVAYLQTL